ncbi:hypothetical protein [Ramlibacter alkalitolerans]|uniref:DUF4132 domain-containing protein n=1 Tax=Ramlibacter alkalitolerans TaxID=2039631 RepID=A0ABS1JU42_9BURK|nr:hypothetical protein [Ramlibacter alkalitolerans]MBL0427819.1 hypothetical protein [Ramlibacter alkalitolerans]
MFNLEELPIVDDELVPAPAKPAPVAVPPIHTIDGQVMRLKAAAAAFRAGESAEVELLEFEGRKLLVSDLVQEAFKEALSACNTADSLAELAKLDASFKASNVDYLVAAVRHDCAPALAEALPLISLMGGAARHMEPGPNFFASLRAQPTEVQANWLLAVGQTNPSVILDAAKMPMGELLAAWKDLGWTSVESAARLAGNSLHSRAFETMPDEAWARQVHEARAVVVPWMRELPPWERPEGDARKYLLKLRVLDVIAGNKRPQLGLVLSNLSGRFRGPAGAIEEHSTGLVPFLLRADTMRTLEYFCADGHSHLRTDPWNKGVKEALSTIGQDVIDAASPQVLCYLAELRDGRVYTQELFERAVGPAWAANAVMSYANELSAALVVHGTLPDDPTETAKLYAALTRPRCAGNHGWHGSLRLDADNMARLFRHAGEVSWHEHVELPFVKKHFTANRMLEHTSDGRNVLHYGGPFVVAHVMKTLPAEDFVRLLNEPDARGATPPFTMSEATIAHLHANSPGGVIRGVDPFQKSGPYELWKARPQFKPEAHYAMAKAGEHLRANIIGRSADTSKVYLRVQSCAGKDFSRKTGEKGCCGRLQYDAKRDVLVFYAGHMSDHDISHYGVTTVPELLDAVVNRALAGVLKEYDNRGHLNSLRAPEPKKTKSKGAER